MNRSAIWGLLALSLLGAGLYGRWHRTVRKAAKLITDAGVRQLRAKLRPVVSHPRVIIFAFDGIGAAALYAAIHDGQCRNIRQLLGAEQGDGRFAHGYAVPETMSILPSTTMAAWASIFTGQPPAFTGVPGNEWFAREEGRFYAPAPVSVTEITDTLRMLAEGLVGDAIRVPTLHELLDRRAHVSLAPVYRGADLFTYTDPTILANLFGAVAKGVLGEKAIKQEAYQQVDEKSVESLLEAIDQYGAPDLQVIYFPGIDLFSHIAEAPLCSQPRYLETVLDPAIGRVLDAYRRAGILENTYVIFIADHGHTPVLNDDRHSLSTTGDHEPPALLERLGFRVRPFVLDSSVKKTPESKVEELIGSQNGQSDYNAVVAYQGAMAYIYLANRSGEIDWRRAPRLEEEVMVVARAFDRVNRTGDPIPEMKGSLDLVFARPPRPIGEDALPFQIFDGERLVDIGTYLRRHPRQDLIRLETRMHGLAAGPYGHRAGDVLLLTRSGLEVPIEERFYFSGPYRSWHGSPTRQDSHVPLIVAHGRRSGEELQAVTSEVLGAEPSQLDLVPLVLRLFDKA